jgi:PadR family transcriptional regulator, regulatory protein AphA
MPHTCTLNTDISIRYMELGSTAYVILGMLRGGARTGYEIKQVVDKSTRFFWAASYGQIYPELRKLAAAGLVEGTGEPSGGRRRKVYRLTPAGRRELRRWLEEPPATFELRDEGLLKLFFSGAGTPGAAAESVAAKRRFHADKLERLREIEPAVKASDDPYPYTVLRHGIEYSEWMIAWCERVERELADAPDRRKRRAA